MSINILGHYRFEGNVNDSSVHGNNGTVFGVDITYQNGILGKGLNFLHKNNESPGINYGVALPIINNDLTRPFFISCFIRQTSGTSNNQVIASVNLNVASTGQQLRIVSDFLHITNSSSSSAGSFGININQIYHIVGIWTETGCQMYVNGILRVNYSGSYTNYLADVPISIGAFDAGNSGIIIRSFNGIIDEVVIGTGVPSLPDIKRMMMGLRPLDIDPQPFYADVQYYKNLVLADGGTFDEEVFYQCYSSGKRVVRKEANVWIVPGAYKTGIIYGINVVTKTLVPFTYSRGSVATYYDKNGQLQTAAANIPRIDYDPVTKQLKGYLFENTATNLISNSLLDGNATNWVLNFVDVTYNTGTTSYGRPLHTLSKTDNNGSRSIASNSFTSVANSTYAFRITLRAGTVNRGGIGIGGSVDGSGSIWGASVDTGGRIISGPGIMTAGDGSLKYIQGLSSTEDTVVEIYRKYNNSGIIIMAYIYPGYPVFNDAGSSIQISSPQLEVNALGVCTSQIDTNGSTQTRATETLISQSNLINDLKSTLYFEGSMLSTENQPNTIFTRHPGASGGYFIYKNVATDKDQFRMFDGTTSVSRTISNSNGINIKAVGSFKDSGNMKLNINTLSIVSSPYDGMFGTPGSTFNHQLMGTVYSSGRVQNYLKSFAIIHRQLTDAEHIELTK